MKLIDERLKEEFERLEKQGLTGAKRAELGVLEYNELKIILEYLGEKHGDPIIFWEGFSIVQNGNKSAFTCTGETISNDITEFNKLKKVIVQALEMRQKSADQAKVIDAMRDTRTK